MIFLGIIKTADGRRIRRTLTAAVFFMAAFFFITGSAVYGADGAAAETVKPVKYIFLFIGDGMATPQRMMTDLYLKSIGKKEGLLMNRLPVQGFATTYSATSLITDSAASATAMATGQKTHDGAIGVDVNNKALENIAELARKKGKKVGIITTTSMNHATPAAFYAHQHSRGNAYRIGLDMIGSGFEYFAGGGLMDPKGRIMVSDTGAWVPDPDKNKKDLYDLIREKGIVHVKSRADFEKLSPSGVKGRTVYVENPRQDNEQNVYYALDKNPGDITLAEYVAKAIELLDGENGFFIMTEGGKIDWSCHANDAAGAMAEVISLDEAIAEACRFAEKHPDDTLIVVTGDHETGAMTLGFTGTGYRLYLANLQNQKKTCFALREEFNVLRNEAKKAKKELTFDEVKPFITKNFGLKFEGDAKQDKMVLSDYEISKLEAAFKRSAGSKEYAPTENRRIMYGSYDPLIVACTHMLANKSGIAWASFDHSAMPVGTSAQGPNAAIFGNLSDNTDIAKNMRKVLEAK